MAEIIKVFLSHKQEDGALAASIAVRLRQNQLDVYLDVIDTNLGKTGPDLADYLRTEMSKCSQLLAVISARTSQSQWVPWEIGVATEKEYPLASYIDQVPPPEFLRKWPYLRSLADVDKYANASKSTRRTMIVESMTRSASMAKHHAFRNFYSSLRSSLGQFD